MFGRVDDATAQRMLESLSFGHLKHAEGCTYSEEETMFAIDIVQTWKNLLESAGLELGGLFTGSGYPDAKIAMLCEIGKSMGLDVKIHALANGVALEDVLPGSSRDAALRRALMDMASNG